MLPVALLCFAAIGALSIPFPEILGNGKAGNELSFSHQLTVQAAFGLLAAKWLAVLLAVMAGAYGGRITPSMMLGGLTAFIGAWCWNLVFPPIPLGLAAFIGAAVFFGLGAKHGADFAGIPAGTVAPIHGRLAAHVPVHGDGADRAANGVFAAMKSSLHFGCVEVQAAFL